LINHFLINDSWFLADLPGYGYAKVSKKQRTKFHNFTIEYLQNRENLMCVFVLIDARLSPQKIDVEFMEFCALRGFPFVMIFTKMDKLNQREKIENIAHYKEFMANSWEELPEMFFTSAEKQWGREEVLTYIHELNGQFQCP
jgi:GTP-binding protein